MFSKTTLLGFILLLAAQTAQAVCLPQYQQLIDQKRTQKTFLGNATSDYTPIVKGFNIGCQRIYQNGVILIQPNGQQAFEVSGLNRVKYDKLQGVYGFLGYPTSDEMNTPDNKGRYNTFEGGSIYYRNGTTESFEVHGSIGAKWLKMGGVTGTFGYPVTDETTTPDQIGRFNHFQNGSLYYRPCVGGAFQVTGLIRNKWAELGWEQGYLGYPLSDELSTDDNKGKYNRFQRGIVVWHPNYGAHLIWGKAYHKWLAANGVKGVYGYPTGEIVCGLNTCQQKFSKSNMNIPFSEGIDMRSEIAKRSIAIRDQGPRGTCSVQTMTFLLEYAYTQMCGEVNGYNHLSVEYLNHVANKATNKSDDGDFFSNIASGYDKYGMIKDSYIPYDPNRTYNYASMEITVLQNGYEAIGQDLLKKLTLVGKFIKPNDGSVGLTDAQMSEIKSYLDRQIPVGVGRGHSLPIVGYELSNTYPGGGRFIFRNSYGIGTGQNGYQYEDFQSVKMTANDVYVYDIPGMAPYIPQPH